MRFCGYLFPFYSLIANRPRFPSVTLRSLSQFHAPFRWITARAALSACFALLACAPLMSAQPFGYVAINDSNTVSVIDTVKNAAVASIKVGKAPQGIAVTPDGSHAYVANGGDGTVSVIDTTTNSIVATIPEGGGPRSIAIRPDGKRALVTNPVAHFLCVIDACRI